MCTLMKASSFHIIIIIYLSAFEKFLTMTLFWNIIHALLGNICMQVQSYSWSAEAMCVPANCAELSQQGSGHIHVSSIP